MGNAHEDNFFSSHQIILCETPNQVLCEQELFQITPEVGKQLLQILDEPAAKTESLLLLRDVKVPWQDLSQPS